MSPGVMLPEVVSASTSVFQDRNCGQECEHTSDTAAAVYRRSLLSCTTGSKASVDVPLQCIYLQNYAVLILDWSCLVMVVVKIIKNERNLGIQI